MLKSIIKLIKRILGIKEKPPKCHVCGYTHGYHKPSCYKNYYQ
jgi:hypothetical protein